MLLINLFLAFTWVGLTGELTLLNLAFGFLFGFLALYLVSPYGGGERYPLKLWYFVEFTGYFLWHLILANLKVAYDVVTPTHHMRPGIVSVPLDIRSALGVTLLGNMISLTPGTLTLHVEEDNSMIYVHVMHLSGVEEFRDEIKNGLEFRLRRLLP